ncbi:unnamed protein product [Phaeothamnion confervicola]
MKAEGKRKHFGVMFSSPAFFHFLSSSFLLFIRPLLSQDDVDLLEFTEAYQEVLTALSDADNESYSAAFADYSGGGHLKGSQFIAKARISVKIARDHYADALRALKIDP